MSDFDYDRAEADLYDSGCPDSEEIYEYRSDRGIDSFMRENGLNPDNYRSNDNYHPSGNDSGNSGCYLTTACIECVGMSDNCVELNVLRKYRDNYLSACQDGHEEIKFYYENAPKIVQAVNDREDRKVVWNQVYQELILGCINLIGHNELEAAHVLYKSYTLNMLKKYVTK